MKLTKTTAIKVNSKSNEDLASIQALQLMFTDKLSQEYDFKSFFWIIQLIYKLIFNLVLYP
jgi:hypothetical protein